MANAVRRYASKVLSEEQAPARLLLSLLNVEVFGGGITLSTFQ
jgi:hypothetical protein